MLLVQETTASVPGLKFVANILYMCGQCLAVTQLNAAVDGFECQAALIIWKMLPDAASL